MNWISVTEKLPDLDVDVLVATACKNIFVLQRITIGPGAEMYWTDFERPFFEPEDITHWMPLPALPNPQSAIPTPQL